jgi:hypothetical protein
MSASRSRRSKGGTSDVLGCGEVEVGRSRRSKEGTRFLVGGERGAGAEVVLPELEGLAVEADADQALADGEGDAAVGVEPGVLLVLAEDGELGAVDRAQLGERQAQLERSESVDLDQGPATLEGVADGYARDQLAVGRGHRERRRSFDAQPDVPACRHCSFHRFSKCVVRQFNRKTRATRPGSYCPGVLPADWGGDRSSTRRWPGSELERALERLR